MYKVRNLLGFRLLLANLPQPNIMAHITKHIFCVKLNLQNKSSKILSTRGSFRALILPEGIRAKLSGFIRTTVISDPVVFSAGLDDFFFHSALRDL